jgi:neurotrimin
VKTQTILSMDESVVTRNSRISVIQREGDLWQLTIKNVKPSDQGWYMCQINTDPMESQVGYLEVTGKHKQQQP